MCVCVCVCVRACVRACVHECVRACLCVCVLLVSTSCVSGFCRVGVHCGCSRHRGVFTSPTSGDSVYAVCECSV